MLRLCPSIFGCSTRLFVARQPSTLGHRRRDGHESLRSFARRSQCAQKNKQMRRQMERWKPKRESIGTDEASKPIRNPDKRQKRIGSISSALQKTELGSIPASTGKLAPHVVWRPRGNLRPFPRNPRQHPDAQILKPDEGAFALLDHSNFDR